MPPPPLSSTTTPHAHPHTRMSHWCSPPRNPLHALAGSARFIQEASRPGDEVYEDACIVLDNATSMSNLITAIADWTSATSDTSDPVMAPCDIVDLCRRAVSGVRSRPNPAQAAHTHTSYHH
jgi:hypothetical protein